MTMGEPKQLEHLHGTIEVALGKSTQTAVLQVSYEKFAGGVVVPHEIQMSIDGAAVDLAAGLKGLAMVALIAATEEDR